MIHLIDMAGEVGHVVYGARLLSWLQGEIEEPSYWAGTLFPDIRHLGVVSRHKTHPKGISLEGLAGKNDFHTGMRAHAWVDATREKFFRDNNVKETLPWHPFVPHALKLFEDELVYEKFEDWDYVIRALNTIYEDELFYIDSQEHVQRWHEILKNYLAQKPTDETRMQLSIDIGLSEQSAAEVNSVIARLRSSEHADALVTRFLNHLEQVLT